jgi:hypothetical protein
MHHRGNCHFLANGCDWDAEDCLEQVQQEEALTQNLRLRRASSELLRRLDEDEDGPDVRERLVAVTWQAGHAVAHGDAKPSQLRIRAHVEHRGRRCLAAAALRTQFHRVCKCMA